MRPAAVYGVAVIGVFFSIAMMWVFFGKRRETVLSRENSGKMIQLAVAGCEHLAVADVNNWNV
ncbi:hypothetical protein ABO04_07315 [Nitrosomonas sp. HPC101]|uniref:hypothetical protein n=1 Tax=Nitrosomonas sp. HPC101 TaxID=1658667 RepID=UPI001368CCDE|nr:hypothetical protein [Nitrosomonas sp. HPC101]MXS85718.1 hypothetical protein [Nitrosomonas sp. HPC101]